MSSSDSDASSEPHENEKKKARARVSTPPATKKVKPPPTAEQTAKTKRDVEDVVSSLGGTPASKSSSGEKSPFYAGSIASKLSEHFTVVKNEEGDRDVTCKLCSAEKPWKMSVRADGFGNVGKHFKRHHKKEYERAGCVTNHQRTVEKHEETAAENERAKQDPCRELLHMFARLRLPFAVIDDKWWKVA